jgi:hypothetical protein
VVRGWQRLWGVLPLFPRSVPLCREHRAPTSYGAGGCSDARHS